MNKNEECESNSNDSSKGDDKTFINKLLIQMKSQFNNTEGKLQIEEGQPTEMDESTPQEETNSEPVVCMETDEFEGASAKSEQLTDCEISEEDNSLDKPRIVLTFRKPKTKKKQANFKAGEDSKEVILKRSSRRRSKDCNESVLQSAIARKEKSYNESNKPQRLTRQLKPTQKILDNIANAAVKLEKNKNERKSNKSELIDDDLDVSKKYKKLRNGKNESKRPKIVKDSDSDHSGQADSNSSLSSESDNRTPEEKSCRRSLRISSR